MNTVEIGGSLGIEAALEVAHGRAGVGFGEISRRRVIAARDVVNAAVADSGVAHYGINTGFGALAEVSIPYDQLRQLQINLIRSHAAGVGEPLPRPTVRLITLLRARVLAAGHSGVRPVVIERLLQLLERGVHPLIPAQGSVGASGDLAPLAHLALALVGEGEAEFEGEVMPAADALRRAGIPTLELHAKEGLSLINGTQAMTAIATLALERAERLSRAADISGALTIEGMLGSVRAFDPRIHRLRPYAGQARSAANLRNLCLESPLVESHQDCGRVQDPYSMRCMPQVHGAVRDALSHVRSVLEVELDAVTDNPLVFPGDTDGAVPEGTVISGGNFHGQPISMASDFGRIAITTLANIAERRVEQLVNPHLNNGLPAFLTRNSGLNSGLMIAQVTASALVSECKGLCMPASVDSIPSSASREDHVSMGPIAARRFVDVIDNTERVIAIELMAAAQSVDLRAPLTPGVGTAAAWWKVRELVPTLGEDRVLYKEIELLAELVRSGELESAVREVLGAVELL